MPVIECSAGDQYVRASGDTPLLEVYASLPAGLYPPFPPVELPGGVGGLVQRGGFAQNFFFASDVLGATYRTPGGQVVQAGGRVVKNVQGLDVLRPLVGSFGLLGEVLEVTLRLRPGRAFTHLVRPGTLDAAEPGAARFAWQDGGQVHVVHFGAPRELEALRADFAGEVFEGTLDLRPRFPRGMGVGPGDVRDLRFAWHDGGARPEVPAVFMRLVRALGG